MVCWTTLSLFSIHLTLIFRCLRLLLLGPFMCKWQWYNAISVYHLYCLKGCKRILGDYLTMPGLGLCQIPLLQNCTLIPLEKRLFAIPCINWKCLLSSFPKLYIPRMYYKHWLHTLLHCIKRDITHSKEFSGNQGNHQNFDPSLLLKKLWLIFMGIKQKKIFFLKNPKPKYRIQKIVIFYLHQYPIYHYGTIFKI